MANALGQLPNAPLIYVLAQIRFSHIPRMDKRWEDFHERVFESYPRAEAERIEEVSIKDGQPAIGDSIKRWQLTKESGRTGIILDAGMLIFHTTDYKTSESFLSELKGLLREFKEILPDKGVFVTRLGIRHVDLLLEEDELPIDQQVVEKLRLPDIPEIGVSQRMEQVVYYQTNINGTLVIRHRQSVTPDVLPSDIFPNKLTPAPRLFRPRPDNSMMGLLDYDHYILMKDEPFNVDTMIEVFSSLRNSSSAAFRKTTTPDAMAKWEREVQS